MTAPTTLTDLLKGGGRYLRWDELGQGRVVEGTITDIAIRQARKYQSDELDHWDDGSPKMQVVVELVTDLRDPSDPDDDGRRSLSVNLWSGQKRALADACRKADVGEPRPGDRFAVVWMSGAGNARDPRQFAYQITPKPEGPLAAQLAQPAAPPPADPFDRPAPPAPTAAPQQEAGSTAEQVKALNAAGLPHAQIASLLGIPIAAVAALANL